MTRTAPTLNRQAVISSTVLVARDMYEHSYAMDYGTKAGAYVDAFMGALNWNYADAAFAKLLD